MNEQIIDMIPSGGEKIIVTLQAVTDSLSALMNTTAGLLIPALSSEDERDAEKPERRRIPGFIRTNVNHSEKDTARKSNAGSSAPPVPTQPSSPSSRENQNSKAAAKTMPAASEQPLAMIPAPLSASRFRPRVSVADIEKAIEGVLGGLMTTDTKIMTSFRAPTHVDVFYKSIPARLQINAPFLKHIPTQDIFGLVLETVMLDAELREKVLVPVIEYLCREKG